MIKSKLVEKMPKEAQDRSSRAHQATKPKIIQTSNSVSNYQTRKHLVDERRVGLWDREYDDIHPLRLTVFIILAIAWVLLKVSLLTNHWYETEARYTGGRFWFGLWRVCSDSQQPPHNFFVGCNRTFGHDLFSTGSYSLILIFTRKLKSGT